MEIDIIPLVYLVTKLFNNLNGFITEINNCLYINIFKSWYFVFSYVISDKS